MAVARISVTLTLEDESTDLEHLDADLRCLLEELAELDSVEVDRVETGAPPPGTRSSTAVEIAAAAVALCSGGAVLPMLIALLRDWLERRSSGSVRLKIGSDEVEVDRVPTSVQRRAIEEFLDRHRS